MSTSSGKASYKPWQNYPRDDPWPQRDLYLHWQLLYVNDAVELGMAQVSSDWLLHEPLDVSEVFRKWHELRLEQRAGLDASWRSLLLLLTALQPRYYPVIRRDSHEDHDHDYRRSRHRPRCGSLSEGRRDLQPRGDDQDMRAFPR